MHHQNNWITLPWVILSWLTSQICANCGPTWKQLADNLLFSLARLFDSVWLWLILLSNKWKGHLLVTSRLSDVAEKWESTGIKSGLWSSLEASFGDASHYIFVFVLMSPPCPRSSSSRRIRATFCLCDTIEPFLPWYFSQCVFAGLYAHTHRPFIQS